METEKITKEQFNALDPQKVCVCYSAPDVYCFNGIDLKQFDENRTLLELVDELLKDMAVDNFQILMVNSKGNFVKVEILE